MTEKAVYEKYVSNEDWMMRYRDYQQRYAQTIRDSDRVILDLIGEVLKEYPQTQPELLDIGCSTGNLLRHIHNQYPQIQLTGGDMTPSLLQENRENPDLAGIEFKYINLLDLETGPVYDLITVNAVLYLFNQAEFEQALNHLARSLKPGGALIVFDFFHEFEQLLEIVETSRSHPQGLRLTMRPISQVSLALQAAGFSKWDFRPFKISVDLPKGQPYGANSDGFEDLNSYTVPAPDGSRFVFRGALYQPWCHLLARKSV